MTTDLVGADREGGGELIHESLGWHLGSGGLAACFMSPVVMQAPVVSVVVVGHELVCCLRAVSPSWLWSCPWSRGQGCWFLEWLPNGVALLQPPYPSSCSEPGFCH